MLRQYLLAVVITTMVPGMALAAQQSAAPNQSTAPRVAIAPAIPDSHGSAEPGRQSAQQSLARRLSQSSGTIRPPAVDPGMDKLPPATNSTMPVLQPQPNVQSK